MNPQKPRWWQLQQGQALLEYWPTIPVGIMIIIAASGLARWLNSAYLMTVDELNRAGMNRELCNTPEEDDDGPTIAFLGDHVIELIATNYNPTDNVTTVVYRVTSGAQPSISHWVLGVPQTVAGEVRNVSEQWEWTNNDPTTHIAGIKFDTAYESGDENSNDGGPKDKSGGGKKKSSSFRHHSGYRFIFNSDPNVEQSDTREIFMMLSGQYDFEPVTVTIKAGTETYSGTLSAPKIIYTSQDELNGDTLYEGCQS